MHKLSEGRKSANQKPSLKLVNLKNTSSKVFINNTLSKNKGDKIMKVCELTEYISKESVTDKARLALKQKNGWSDEKIDEEIKNHEKLTKEGKTKVYDLFKTAEKLLREQNEKRS